MKISQKKWVVVGAGALAVAFAATAIAANPGAGDSSSQALTDEPGGVCFAELKVDGISPVGSHLMGFVDASYMGSATQEQARAAISSIADGDVECADIELEADSVVEFPGDGDIAEAPHGEFLDEDNIPEGAIIIGGPDSNRGG